MADWFKVNDSWALDMDEVVAFVSAKHEAFVALRGGAMIPVHLEAPERKKTYRRHLSQAP
jgi:hypothetical protein